MDAFPIDPTDCGLGTLGELKRFLLNAGISDDDTFSEALLVIGRGVAATFDNFTGRTLKRAENALETISSTRRNLAFRHSPVESVSKLELKYGEADGYVDITSILARCLLDNEKGMLAIEDDAWIYSTTPVVRHRVGMYRATVTGGYWYDPTDNNNGVKPDGAAVLPNDLKMAWKMQVQHIWVNRDNLGISYAPSGEVKNDSRRQMEKITLLPMVAATLANYVNPVDFR